MSGTKDVSEGCTVNCSEELQSSPRMTGFPEKQVSDMFQTSLRQAGEFEQKFF